MSERIKWLGYQRLFTNRYFWRTTVQQEIDYVEERDGVMQAYEFIWNPKAKTKIPTTFTKAYPHATTHIITPENMDDFLGF